jgi:uncharacterized BrkB/YihY/UPF0761 family membrane protein
VNLANAISRRDGWQQQRRLLGVPVAVVKKFLDDGADALGVQIAYWGFFSVFADAAKFGDTPAGRVSSV